MKENFIAKKSEQTVDWSKVAVDTPILAWDDGKKYRRYFAKYENGKVYSFINGCTRWSSYGATESWKHAELVEVNK